MQERIVVQSSIAIDPLSDEDAEHGLEVIKRARALRKVMLKRRKGKLVPSSWRLIRKAREEYKKAQCAPS